MRFFLTGFFFFFFFFFFSFFFFFFEQQTCQIWVVHSFEIWNLILDEQDTRQNTDLNKSVVQSVSLCLSYLFLYILTSKFVKNWKKIKQAKKRSNLEFCWIRRAPKNKCALQLWDIGFIYLFIYFFFFCLVQCIIITWWPAGQITDNLQS